MAVASTAVAAEAVARCLLLGYKHAVKLGQDSKESLDKLAVAVTVAVVAAVAIC